jgi:hypothetical protein
MIIKIYKNEILKKLHTIIKIIRKTISTKNYKNKFLRPLTTIRHVGQRKSRAAHRAQKACPQEIKNTEGKLTKQTLQVTS